MNICALIVTYNRLEKLKKTWAATELLSFDHIVIVDNSSTDGTADWLKGLKDNRLHIILSNKNDGGAGGFYRGSKWISENISTDWVVLFDDDAFPSPDLLIQFEKENKDEFDVFATRVLTPTGKRCKMNIPWVTIPNSIKDIMRYSKDQRNFVASENEHKNISTFSFVGVIIKLNVLRETYNFIHKELFIYYDDVYYSWHLHNHGFKLCYNPNLIFYHDINEVGSAIPPWKIYYLVRNLILSYQLFKLARPFSLISIVARLLKYVSMLKSSNEKIAFLKAMVNGIRDGLRRN